MDQVTVEPAMEHVQIRGKTNRTEKKKTQKIAQYYRSKTVHASYFSAIILFAFFHNVNFNLFLMLF